MLIAIGVANLLIGVANSINPVARVGWVNLLCAALLMYGLGRIHGKKEALEKECELVAETQPHICQSIFHKFVK